MVRILEIEEYAKKNNVPIMEKDGIDFLTNYIKEHNIKNILEIGSAIGYSAIKMALVDRDIKVTTIERDLDRYNIAIQNIKDFNLQDQINIINADALEFDVDGFYDLIFIDAAKSQYIKFFEKFKKNLNDDGVIVSDNLNFHGLVNADLNTLSRNVRGLVRKLNSFHGFLEQNDEFITDFLTIGDGIGISRRNFK